MNVDVITHLLWVSFVCPDQPEALLAGDRGKRFNRARFGPVSGEPPSITKVSGLKDKSAK